MTHALRGPSKIGLPPGTFVHISKQNVIKATLDVLDYNRWYSSPRQVVPPAEAGPPRSGLTRWVTVCGLQDHELLGQLGRQRSIHPVVLEEMANTSQRTKVDHIGQYAFVVTRLVSRQGGDSATREQVSFVLCRRRALSFLKSPADVFTRVIKRLATALGGLRNSGPDYPVNALVDVLVDRHFLVLGRVGEEIETVTEQAVEGERG